MFSLKIAETNDLEKQNYMSNIMINNLQLQHQVVNYYFRIFKANVTKFYKILMIMNIP